MLSVASFRMSLHRSDSQNHIKFETRSSALCLHFLRLKMAQCFCIISNNATSPIKTVEKFQHSYKTLSCSSCLIFAFLKSKESKCCV